MFYKNWPYWLKGAIIFGIIGILADASFWWCMNHSSNCLVGCLGCLIYIVPALGFGKLLGGLFPQLNFSGTDKNSALAVIYVLNFLSTLLMGIIIGWIYGKIKEQNKNN